MPSSEYQPKTLADTSKPENISWFKTLTPIILVTALLGAIASWAVMSGDQQGRVNLLYLLVLYLALPLLSLVLSCVSLLMGKGISLPRTLLALPLWSRDQHDLMRAVRQMKVDKAWLFLHSQVAALTFSIVSLIIFIILLLVTDVSFVWRSTLLTALDLFPWLDSIAKPWQFWPGAQPTLELLKETQDSRLKGAYANLELYSRWWQFILAVQLTYCVLPRTVLLIIAYHWYRNTLLKQSQARSKLELHRDHSQQPVQRAFKPVLSPLPNDIPINNWANMELDALASLGLDTSSSNVFNSGPLATPEQLQDVAEIRAKQLLVVKAWEPPMGELEDFLQTSEGYLAPLDWNDDGFKAPSSLHLNEWRRFVKNIPNWELSQPSAAQLERI